MDSGTKLTGTWHNVAPDGADITFSGSNFQWGNDEGRWKLQGSEIWLLDPKQNTGTRWIVRVTKGEDKLCLVLESPEDFRYQGQGKYLYFQMTPPTLTHHFERGITP